MRLRPATPEDAPELTALYLLSRKTFLPYAPLAHSDKEVAGWMQDVLIPGGGVTVAQRPDGTLLGMMALAREGDSGWINHLYLLPSAVGQGLGSHFVQRAKDELGPPIRLYTFQENGRAIAFYQRHGFVPVEYGDGAGNEEGCPDVLMAWEGD